MKHFLAAALSALATSLVHPQPVKADSYEYGRWAYNCMHDHKDPYGSVLNPRNCWASICDPDAPQGCVTIFYFTKDRERVGHIEPREGCEYSPSKMAVDGVRIDLLPDEQQIEAVIVGRSLTMQAWNFEGKGHWPYCLYTDQTISLQGSGEVYKRLKQLKPSYLPGD